MTTKIKTKSRILEAVHETAGDLHRLGFIDKRKMRKFDALCLDPVLCRITIAKKSAPCATISN